jgi:signal transduction histidine kinase
MPKHRFLKQIARTVTLFNLAMVLVGVGMVVASFHANGGTVNLRLHIYLFPFIATVFSVFGLLILDHHPENTVGWLIVIVGFSAGLHFLVNAYMAFDEDVLIGNPETLRNLAILLNRMDWWPALVLPFTLVVLYFPDGKLLSNHWRIIVIITLLGLLIGMFTDFYSGPNMDWGNTEPNPAGIQGDEWLLEWLTYISWALLSFSGLSSIFAIIRRFRRSTGVERVQMKWFVYSALACLIPSSIMFIIYILSPHRTAFIQLWYILPTLLTLVFPVTMWIAIVRHRLWDIDIIINRTLVYASLTVLLLVVYLFIVGGLGAVFQMRINTLSSLAATGIIAVLFQPLRDRLQHSVNRLLYGERDDPAAVLARLAHHPETAESPSAILPNLVQTIAFTLKIPHVAIWLPAGAGRMEPIAVWGKVPNQTQTIPLTYQKEEIGDLVVAPRGPQERFNRFERDLLATIAALTATTVRAVQLSDELRRSRQRIVAAREDERRRLRRDLHDSLGPQLASQTLGLEAVAQLMPNNPEKAQAVLSSLKLQAQEAILEVRRLVYDLRPPALDNLGLIGALQQSASRYEIGGLRFNFDVPATLPELPAAVEIAVYRIAMEALTNVVHHAQATLCCVRLFCTDTYVTIEVHDNGLGLPRNHPFGVGLQAMRERTTELNGQFVLESLPGGGTFVQAIIPREVYDE